MAEFMYGLGIALLIGIPFGLIAAWVAEDLVGGAIAPPPPPPWEHRLNALDQGDAELWRRQNQFDLRAMALQQMEWQRNALGLQAAALGRFGAMTGEPSTHLIRDDANRVWRIAETGETFATEREAHEHIFRERGRATAARIAKEKSEAINRHPESVHEGEVKHRLVHSDETGRLFHVHKEEQDMEETARLMMTNRAAAKPMRVSAEPYRAYVDVVNPTPTEDGELERHYIGVPVEMKTAKAAVAWTYGLTEDEYNPVIRT